jgi:hypothetical protein
MVAPSGMNELDPSRTALLALDFQNYGIHPQGYRRSTASPTGRR